MKTKVHSVSSNVDLEMAMVLGSFVKADCGYTWVPTMLSEECDGLPHCKLCFPPEAAEPAAPALRPHYVYRCYDASDRLLYVGCTNNPVKRLNEHAKGSWWGKQVAYSRCLVFPDRPYALRKEREAIATEMPLCNVKGRWPYRTLAWTADDYVDFRRAIVQTIDTTHRQYGKNTKILLAEIDAELKDRFGVTAIDRRPA